MILALTGGIGGSKLLLGLTQVMDPTELTVVVNTADDLILHDLTLCPDLDTVAYTLGGVADQERGWGITGDSFNALEWLGRYGREGWFHPRRSRPGHPPASKRLIERGDDTRPGYRPYPTGARCPVNDPADVE
ncbi:MAG: 2-phospho-L-lactate transferase CofD family protein [Candidatus Methylomirabilis sp.]|nr:2-phospho-L-lactate transferase CofD family protein [Candidatus Methylomirabilis sp.]